MDGVGVFSLDLRVLKVANAMVMLYSISLNGGQTCLLYLSVLFSMLCDMMCISVQMYPFFSSRPLYFLKNHNTRDNTKRNQTIQFIPAASKQLRTVYTPSVYILFSFLYVRLSFQRTEQFTFNLFCMFYIF
jgi:hypothetical protein